MQILLDYIRKKWGSLRLYIEAMARWALLSIVIGCCCGVLGSFFHIGVHYATELRSEHGWLLFCLPLLGLVIVGIYHVTDTEGKGTNSIIDIVHLGREVPLLLVPAIFFGTILTHLGGGSAGREGAALQMGGTIGSHTAKAFHMDDKDMRVATQAGMAAFFAALFGTPVAATVFALMVISIGEFFHAAMVPCLMSSLVAFGISLMMGVTPTHFTVHIPALEPGMLAGVIVLSVLLALVSVLFCEVLHASEHIAAKALPNKWLRAMAGGALIVVLTLVFGGDYNGAGMDVITRAIEEGTARPEAFLLKILFTAITIATGFKGGEVVPAFFTGAVFGCVAGPFLGIPTGAAAAFGLIGVFCGATNCPLASLLLAMELFGDDGMVYFAVVCVLTNILSGYSGLYSSQWIIYSKIKSMYINVHTNGYKAGDPVKESPEKEL